MEFFGGHILIKGKQHVNFDYQNANSRVERPTQRRSL